MKNIKQSKIISYITLLLLILPVFLFSQESKEITIKGKIREEAASDSLAGAVIRIKGTSIGTTSDADGNFQLKTTTPPPFTISISFIGYETKEIEVYEANEPLEIKLKPSNVLKEVVIVGYGEQKRKDITGSVASVPTELKSQPVASVERLLQGSIAGAVVTQTSGQPGGGECANKGK
jgi:hypothetical protein